MGTSTDNGDFMPRGLRIEDNFLTPAECRSFLEAINEYRKTRPATAVFREAGDRALNYSVIDGLQIRQYLPEIHSLLARVNLLVDRLTGIELFPLENERVACNINITRKGGTYRWHYDRNLLTALIYLNEVEGGETECYPNYRIGSNRTAFQRYLDDLLSRSLVRSVFGTRVVCRPATGRLLIMCGNRCLHSVRPVTSDSERINIVLSYDRRNANFAVEGKLDTYLYEPDSQTDSDPNYRRA